MLVLSHSNLGTTSRLPAPSPSTLSQPPCSLDLSAQQRASCDTMRNTDLVSAHPTAISEVTKVFCIL